MRLADLLDQMEAAARYIALEVKYLRELHPKDLKPYEDDLKRALDTLRNTASALYATNARARQATEDNSAATLRKELGL